MNRPPLSVDLLEKQIQPLRQRLLDHPVYAGVQSLAQLQSFMQQHVFAVWDFMSLLKRLQAHTAGCSLPWVPPADATTARFINEIVLGEECDEDRRGSYSSHFELYLEAMSDVGADRTVIENLVTALQQGTPFSTIWPSLKVQEGPRQFVETTLDLALKGQIHEVAASFCYGREEVIPDMFSRLVPVVQSSGLSADRFLYYLERHIELDGDEHGDLARQLVERLIGDSPQKLAEATRAAEQAILSRIQLWEGVLQEISPPQTAS